MSLLKVTTHGNYTDAYFHGIKNFRILTFRLFGTNNILFGHTLSSEDLDLKKLFTLFKKRLLKKYLSTDMR